MSGLHRVFARPVPARQLGRGWHVEFTGRWWLVQEADEQAGAVSVTLTHSVFCPEQVSTRFGVMTAVWARDPQAQMRFVVAAERERRDLVLDAAVERLGSALLFEVAA